jgi:hypothetical protein
MEQGDGPALSQQCPQDSQDPAPVCFPRSREDLQDMGRVRQAVRQFEEGCWHSHGRILTETEWSFAKQPMGPAKDTFLGVTVVPV